MELPENVKIRRIEEFELSGHRVAIADLAFGTPFGPGRSVRWAGWQGETGIVKCAWDTVSTDEALRRVASLAIEESKSCPVLRGGSFVQRQRGLRCAFAPGDSGWLVVEKLWPGQKDRSGPQNVGVPVAGGYLYRRSEDGKTPSIHLEGPTATASFILSDGVAEGAVERIVPVSIEWT